MSRSNVVLAKNINVSKLKFSEPKTLSNGSSTVYINYEGEKLTIQTPVMRLPYGLGDWNDKNNAGKKAEDAIKKYDLSVSFTDYDSNPKMKTLLDKMHEIEKRIIEEAFEHRVSWLQDDYEGSKTLVGKLFWPIVQIDKDKQTKKVVGKYPPTMKLKLPYDNRNDVFSFEAQDMEGSAVDFKEIMGALKGAKARLIIQLSGLWFAGGRYGCTWKVVRSMFEVTTKRAIAQFIVDSDDDIDDAAQEEDEEDEDLAEDAATAVAASLKNVSLKSASAPAPPAPAPVVQEAPVAEEEDEKEEEDAEEDAEEEEEEDDDSEVDEPPPPPPPVKKPAAKKATAKK